MLATWLRRFQRSNGDVIFMRAALVVIFAAFGYAKWFDYEAQGLVPLIGNSPLLSWMHQAFGIRGASYALGVAEWSFGLLLLAGFWSRRLGLLGAIGSTVTYLTTLTLIFSRRGLGAFRRRFSGHGRRHQLLIKDLVLLAGSLVLLKADLPAEQA